MSFVRETRMYYHVSVQYRKSTVLLRVTKIRKKAGDIRIKWYLSSYTRIFGCAD